MICLSSSTVMILRRDSTLEPLEPDAVCSRIVRACFAASESNTWIGAEIARSVEFALLSREKRVVTPAELDDMIIRSLEDAGYPRVAEEFGKRPLSPDHDSVAAEESIIADVLTSHLASSPEQCRFLAVRVKNALDTLGFSRASIRLIQELARGYRDLMEDLLPETEPLRNGMPEQFLLSADDERILRSLPPEERSLFDGKAVSFDSVSSLFPALHFRLDLGKFADFSVLEIPVTELAFWNAASRLSSAMDAAAGLAAEQIPGDLLPENRMLPVSIEVTDTLTFGTRYMLCPTRDAAECVRTLMETFAEGLSCRPFKIHC